MWWLTGKIARIVFSEYQGDAENTRRADFCTARSAVGRGYPHLRASCTQAKALKICEPHVTHQGRPAVSAQKNMQDRYVRSDAIGDFDGGAYLRDQSCFRAEGCTVAVPEPPPTTSVNPGARISELRQAPLHTRVSSVMQSHRTSSRQISNRTDEISCTSVVCVPGSKLDAMRTLSRNCAKENQSRPRTQTGNLSSEIVKVPRSLILLLCVFTPHSMCKSAL